MDYETLVRTRITTPLKMEDTRIALSAGMKERMAKGHNESRESTSNWDVPALAGAGALRSDARDMLQFVAAHIGLVESPLAQAMSAMVKVRRPMDQPGTEIALAWIVTTREGREIRWHNGGTGGYRSFIGYDPKSRTGVVVLANMFTGPGVDDIGMHLLNPDIALAKLPALTTHKEVRVDPQTFDRYTGQYELAPGAVFTISREGEHFFAQLSGQSKYEIFAESDRSFFLKVVDAQLTFEDGALVLHQGGRDMRAKRVP
jgi:CubicO group peptidase (beta-lactamase class C family)